MEVYCTRPNCTRPLNSFPDLDDHHQLTNVKQKYCITCGITLILADRYLPIKLLGKGGFGAAFLAIDRYTPAKKRCVVKQFQPPTDLSPDQLKMAQDLFAREGEVLEELGRHGQIPTLFAFFPVTVPSFPQGQENQYFYLVQEFIEGKNLEEELMEKGKFSETEITEVLTQILNVLKFVHDEDSIHRDIKPSNIMRKTDGTLILLDFGAVKKATSVHPGGRSTGIYTPGYAPNEQMSGGQVYHSTDLYALAATCVQLLTGQHPTELFDTFNNIWTWRDNVVINDDLANVLETMLKHTPNQRFQSANDALLALNHPPEVTPTNTINTTPPITINPPISPISNPPNPPINPPVSPISNPPNPPINPPVSPISNTNPVNTPVIKSKPPFSLLEIILASGATGAESGLLYIALMSLFSSVSITFGLLGPILGSLIFLQYKKILADKDMPIIAVITLGLVIIIPALNKGFAISLIIGITVLTGCASIAIIAVFKLVYKYLSKLM